MGWTSQTYGWPVARLVFVRLRLDGADLHHHLAQQGVVQYLTHPAKPKDPSGWWLFLFVCGRIALQRTQGVCLFGLLTKGVPIKPPKQGWTRKMPGF